MRLHISGNARRILRGMGRLGCNIVDLDYLAPDSVPSMPATVRADSAARKTRTGLGADDCFATKARPGRPAPPF
jgi:hypothetical protein